MTLRRATLYIGGGTLFAAWFSSAASLSLGRGGRPASPADRSTDPPAQALAVSVQTQARRLRQRLEAAPTPQQPVRNPFAFRPLPAVPSAPAPRPVVEPAPRESAPAMPDPPLQLVGLAERQNGDKMVRSAVISTVVNTVVNNDVQDLIMAEVGTVILGRYTVTSIGSDAVEMKDTATGGVRRLVLQAP
jgi:hypothetical protein